MGSFARAAHERRQQDSHFAVALAGEGAGSHYRGDRAAESHQHGDEAPTGKPQLTQRAVHYEGDARHVAGVLKYRQEEEQRDYSRQEAEHAPDAGAYAVHHQRLHHRVDLEVFQPLRYPVDNEVHAHAHQVGEPRSDKAERHQEHYSHYTDEAGDSGVFSGQQAVYLYAAPVLAALPGAHDGFFAEVLKEREPHVCQGGFAVHSCLLLHDVHKVVERMLLFVWYVDLLPDKLVVFDQLCRRKPHGKPRRLYVRREQHRSRVDTAVHCSHLVSRIPAFGAEIHAYRYFPIARDVYRVVDKFVDTLVFRRGDRNDRYSEYLLKLVDEDRAAVGAYLVHHVEGEHHRYPKLHELHGEVEVSFDIRSVNDVDDTAGVGVQQKIPGDYLLV